MRWLLPNLPSEYILHQYFKQSIIIPDFNQEYQWCILLYVLSVCKCGRRWWARLDQYCKMIVSGNPPQKTNTAHKMSTKAFYGLAKRQDFTLDKFLNINKVERKVSLRNCLILWERHFRSGFASLFCLFIVLLLLLRHLIQFNASISVHNTRAQNILLFGDTSAKILVPTQRGRKGNENISSSGLIWWRASGSVGRTERGECPLRGLLSGKGTPPPV